MESKQILTGKSKQRKMPLKGGIKWKNGEMLLGTKILMKLALPVGFELKTDTMA